MSDTRRTITPETTRSRRDFLRKGVVTAIASTPMAVGVLASCSEGTAQKTATASDSDHSGGSTAPNPTTPAPAAVDPRARADQMDAMHEKAFHCHILPHAESEHGMFGMVTALIVDK